MECESELSFITEQGIDQVTTRDRATGPVYSRPGRISLVTVEREVRVYSLGVSDPMLRYKENKRVENKI